MGQKAARKPFMDPQVSLRRLQDLAMPPAMRPDVGDELCTAQVESLQGVEPASYGGLPLGAPGEVVSSMVVMGSSGWLI